MRLAEFSALVANNSEGRGRNRANKLLAKGLGKLTTSDPGMQQLLARGREYVRRADEALIIAHEEGLSHLEHLVLLHGSDDENEIPSDGEIALWLLAAADHLGDWAEPDDRTLTTREELIAEEVRVHRYNRSLDAQRASLSGVSIDEESLNLLNFQRQYQAGARLIDISNQLLTTLMQIV